jgi:hypothetical protein
MRRRRREDRRPGERAEATGPSCGPGPADDDGDGDGLRAVARNTGAATVSGGGRANSGVWIDQLVRQEAPRQPAPWPHMVGTPPGRALGFQERAESSQLRTALEAEGTAVVGQVLSGLGGVGKTQLAADYARTAFASGRLDVLVWVTAASRQAVVDGYARAAVELLGAEPDEDSAERFLAWLQPSAARAVCRWLVVLDDLANPADLTGLWPPACASGRTVVTTRRRGAALTGPGRRRVDVGVFTAAQAAAALHQMLAERGHPAQPPEQVEALAAELGFLPLALAQAAAYITNEDIGVQRYRELLAARLLQEVVPEEGELPDDHQRIISATWELSIDQADAARPAGLARPVLQMASMLDPAGIPQDVLSSPPALGYLATYQPEQEHVVDEAMVDAVLRVLHRYSLIDHDRALICREVRVHQLVQRATRENLNAQADLGPDLYAAVADTVADALLDIWPQVEQDELGQVLRANSAALQQAAGQALWSRDEGGHVVLFRSATSLGQTGQATAARDAFSALCHTALHYVGPDHPDTLAARGNLARWRGEAGDAAGAAGATEELLADYRRVLGPDHPQTLTVRGELARWRGEAGDAAGAATAYEQVLADSVRVLGRDHPQTVTVRGNLARWRGEAGDAAGAVTAYEETLAAFLRELGPYHPQTLLIRGQLAQYRGEAGDAAGAAAATEELLADSLAVLGPGHPQTLTGRHNLAHWRGQAGDAAGAAIAYKEVLADCLRLLSPDHPDTLNARGQLAHWRGQAGDVAGAATATEELLADYRRVLGPYHARTLAARGQLAHWRGQAGDAAGAVTAYEETLADCLRVLGPDHPETLLARGQLARWRGQAGDVAGAAIATQEALADHLRVHGPDHPSTLAICGNLAHWRGQAGDAAGAVTAYEETLADCLRVLGPDHPLTLFISRNLAGWRKRRE